MAPDLAISDASGNWGIGRVRRRLAANATAIALFVAVAAILIGHVPDRAAALALMLNLALVVLAWQRAPGETEAVRTRAPIVSDPLTGLLNRRSLMEEGAALTIVGSRRNKALALLLIDLDHFRAINEGHGQAVADLVLRQVAEAIRLAAPAGAVAARLGGDEFAIAMLFDPEHAGPVERVADDLVRRLGEQFEVDGLDIMVGASIGIARSDLHGPGIDSLMRCAEIAVRAAKSEGRGRAIWFNAVMERARRAQHELENGLRAAIAEHKIVPYFEKQVDLASGQITGFEVLARWEHAVLGTVPPDQFIPLAEKSGLIGEMSLSIMRQAFRAASDWDPSLSLSVNISPCQIRDPWLAQKIIKVLTETGFPAARLQVEITEKALFDNLALAQSIIASLKNQGIRVALDDFGTGYSSLAHLRALPFDDIKIDKSFVLTINESAESAAIVNAVIRLGDSLNLPITAEGIATRAIEDRLRALGCGKGQGYFYGMPMSANNTRRLLAEKRLIATPATAQRPPLYAIASSEQRAAS